MAFCEYNSSTNNRYGSSAPNLNDDELDLTSNGLLKIDSMVTDLLNMPEQPLTNKPARNFNNKGCDPILDQILNTVQMLRKDYSNLEQKLDNALGIVQDNKKEIVNLKATINEQEKRIQILESHNDSMLKALNNSDREARSSSLIFSGDLFKFPNNSSPSSLASAVEDVCTRELDCAIPHDSFSACRLIESQTGKKSVLLTFSRISIKEQLLTKAIQTKKKRTLYKRISNPA